jgi:hypothetical protein
LEKYAEALELMWFQYVVGYDQQEQRSLATSLQIRLLGFRHFVSIVFDRTVQMLPSDSRGVVPVVIALVAALLLFLLARRIRRFGWRRILGRYGHESNHDESMVEFYRRLTALLAQRGIQRDTDLTPLEFAGRLDFPEAWIITRAYNRVRFGRQRLSAEELKEIERALTKLEETFE